MNVALLALTVVSLVAATGFGMLMWHLIREDRERSAARVAVLATAIDADTVHAPASSPVAVGTLFRLSASSTRGRPVIKATAIGAMAVTLIVLVAMATGRGSSSPERTVAARAAAPLELVSMRHVRTGSTLTVSGLVRNPAAGAPAINLTAVVFAFDPDANFVASGRAPIEIGTLEPGDESPFVVAVPDVDNVGRYRVSFRTELGLVRHVDRRADQAAMTATLR